MIVHMDILSCSAHGRNERSVAPHRHEHDEWHFAVAGSAGFEIGSATVDFTAGDLLLVPTGVPHRLRVRAAGEWIVQVIVATRATSAEVRELMRPFTASACDGRVAVGVDRYAFFAGLAADLASGQRLRRMGAGLRFSAMLCDIAAGTASAPSPLVARALELMRRRIAGRLTLAELAHAAGCGRSILARRFRAEVGEPPLKHHLGMRLELGADLLRQGGRQVREVAAACGFDDPYHFSRCFRRRYGRPPSGRSRPPAAPG